jgi:2-dehydro-3-deoxyphosphogluconate aldolase/(4S)-4-hydroxy-2-oxoglutarate aldolase
MEKETVLQTIKQCGLVAVVRAMNADDARRIAEACMAGGVAGIELTYTVPGVTDIIRALANEYKNQTDFIIGAGTVLDPETARDAILSGAQYIVSPCLNLETVKLCQRYRVPVMPGAMTIKEAVEVMEAGADVIKIFPGELFGPKIISAIKGPLPHARMMPTGGVSIDNVGDWIKAGAVAVGAGSSLTGGAKIGDYTSITELAKRFIEAIHKARNS